MWLKKVRDDGVVGFGAFEVNLDFRELRKHGVRVKLPEQCFRALAVLLEAKGELVSRDELRNILWDKDVHVSFDRNLNSIIHTLREALGDSAKNPRFITTVPGRGYRFLAPVFSVAPPVHESRRLPLAVVAVLVVALAGWIGYRITPSRRTEAGVVKLAPITSLVGVEGHPSFSPDGQSLVFHWNGVDQKNFDIYVKREDSADLLRLTRGPANNKNPAWSPDGRWIAFLRTGSELHSSLMLIPAGGGEDRLVARIPATNASIAWSRDGKWLAYTVTLPDYVRNRPGGSGVQAVSVATGRSIQVTQPGKLSQWDAFPSFSPDGKRLAFVRLTSFATGDLFVVKLDERLQSFGEPRRLTFDHADARSPEWTADGKEIVFSSNRAGYRCVWKVSADHGGTPVLLGGQDVGELTVAPVGDRIAYASQVSVHNLWKTFITEAGGLTGAPKRITYSTQNESSVSYSPDGSRLAFGSSRSGEREIWVCDSDGSNPRQLTSFGGPASGAPRWSPDGRRLAFDSRVDGKGEILIVSATGGEPRRLTTNPADDIVPSWSHDGRWVYFVSNRTGVFQVWKKPAAGGEPIQITRNGGFHAEESPDGKYLYYAKSMIRTAIWRVPVSGGEEVKLTGPLDLWSNFSVHNDGIYFTGKGSQETEALYFFDIATRRRRRLGPIGRSLSSGMAVAPDERSAIFALLVELQSDVIEMTFD